MKNAVRFIAIASSILYTVFIGIAISMLVNKELTFVSFLGYIFVIGISLVLLWALDHALARIETLENILLKKNIITDNDVELETMGFVEETPDKISECKKCGYQLFSEDEVCPNCGSKVDYDNESHLRRKCHACGETISFDDEICPYCGAKIQSEEIVLCKSCGFQLFPEDEICFNCGKPVK